MRDHLYTSRLPACCEGNPAYTARANTESQELMQYDLEEMVGVTGMEGRKVLSTNRRRHKETLRPLSPILELSTDWRIRDLAESCANSIRGIAQMHHVQSRSRKF